MNSLFIGKIFLSVICLVLTILYFIIMIVAYHARRELPKIEQNLNKTLDKLKNKNSLNIKQYVIKNILLNAQIMIPLILSVFTLFGKGHMIDKLKKNHIFQGLQKII